MLGTRKRKVRDLIRSLLSLNYYEESLFYLDYLWGLHPYFPGNLSTIKFCFFFFISCSYISLTTVMLVQEYEGIETLKKSDVLSPSAQIGFTLFTYKLNNHIVRDLIDKTERFWKIEDHMTDIIQLLNGARYYIFFYKSVIFGTTMYYNYVALTNPEVPFATDCYHFCDIENNKFCYWFMFCYIDLSAFVLVWGIYTFDGFFAGSVAQVIVQLRLIKHKLQNLKFEGSESDNEEALVELIEHHSFVLAFIEDINELYSKILLTQFFSLIFSMCIGSFLLTLHGTPSVDTLTQYIIYLCCMFGQVFFYSYGGQIIVDESASIAESAYDTDWFQAKISTQKTIATIIMKSQQETKISVGGFSNLDLRMYLYAAKSAFSFYTMMNQMYEKDSD